MIADDHPTFRRGLKYIFSETPDIVVQGEAQDGRELLAAMPDNPCDVVLLDIAMPGPSGFEILKQLKEQYPNLPVLILSMYPEDRYGERFLRLGAAGYLNKESSPDQLLDGVRQVARGEKYISPTLAEKRALISAEPKKTPHELLSNREYEVMCLLASGKTVTEVARELFLSVKTVSTHRAHILQKMEMKNNAQLILYAVQRGLLE